MEELISKKELLEKYGISYGALYRWKRMGLIPEEWFEKKSAVTGQETFFPRAAITERIEMILSLKDEMSLEEIVAKLNVGEEKGDTRQLRIVWDGGTTQIPLAKIFSASIVNGAENPVIDLTTVLGKTAKVETEDIMSKVEEEIEKVEKEAENAESSFKQLAKDLEGQIEEAKKAIEKLLNTKGLN